MHHYHFQQLIKYSNIHKNYIKINKLSRTYPQLHVHTQKIFRSYSYYSNTMSYESEISANIRSSKLLFKLVFRCIIAQFFKFMDMNPCRMTAESVKKIRSLFHFFGWYKLESLKRIWSHLLVKFCAMKCLELIFGAVICGW